MVEKTLDNWVRARRSGTLKAAGNQTTVSAEQMENSRLRAELARVTMERDILRPSDEDLGTQQTRVLSDGTRLSMGTPVQPPHRGLRLEAVS